MAILDRFRKKPEEAPKEKEAPVEKKEALEQEIKEKAKVSAEQKKPRRTREKKSGIAFKVLKSPYITEKSTDLGKRGQYTFKIFDRANKTQVKRAIEELYSVEVKDVKISRKPSKKIRFGRREGTRPGFKKALVRLKQGQTIDIFPH